MNVKIRITQEHFVLLKSMALLLGTTHGGLPSIDMNDFRQQFPRFRFFETDSQTGTTTTKYRSIKFPQSLDEWVEDGKVHAYIQSDVSDIECVIYDTTADDALSWFPDYTNRVIRWFKLANRDDNTDMIFVDWLTFISMVDVNYDDCTSWERESVEEFRDKTEEIRDALGQRLSVKADSEIKAAISDIDDELSQINTKLTALQSISLGVEAISAFLTGTLLVQMNSRFTKLDKAVKKLRGAGTDPGDIF